MKALDMIKSIADVDAKFEQLGSKIKISKEKLKLALMQKDQAAITAARQEYLDATAESTDLYIAAVQDLDRQAAELDSRLQKAVDKGAEDLSRRE
jgi:hypothetical protein